MSTPEQDAQKQRQRRAVRTAIITGAVALAFYVGYFFFKHYTRG